MVRILEVRTEHVIPFKALIEVLKEILTEVIFEFKKEPIKESESDIKKKDKKKKKRHDKEESCDSDSDNDGQRYEGGIKVLTISPTKSVLIYLKFDINEFSKFKCKRNLELGINLLMLFKLLKSVDKGDSLTLYYDDSQKQYLGITSYNSDKRATTEDKLKLMDIDVEKLKIPSLVKYDGYVSMPASEFHKMCRDISNIAEHLEIKCTQNSIIFKCKGDYAIREKTYSTTDDDKNSISITQTAEKGTILQGVYELKDLTLFNKCNNFCNDVEIIMKNNRPLVLKYVIGTVGRAILAISPVKLDDDGIESDEDDDYGGTIKYK